MGRSQYFGFTLTWNWVPFLQLAAHLAEATRLQKPLLIGEFNLVPFGGLPDRNAFLSQIYGDLQAAAAEGQAVAGVFRVRRQLIY